MGEDRREKRIAVIRRPSFGYIPGEGFVFKFDAAMEGGVATIELCENQALEFVKSCAMADINYFKGKPVWVEVEQYWWPEVEAEMSKHSDKERGNDGEDDKRVIATSRHRTDRGRAG